MATVYVDLFRAIPGSSSSSCSASGSRRSASRASRTRPFFWGVVALTLVYSAYVSEVYRAGIESVHPSQDAAARSLGLSQFQAMRYVVVPQAVRRVIPPLLNDFIGLQKDTVLVSYIGVVEVFRQAQIKQSATFNFTPYLGGRARVHRGHHPARAVHRLAGRARRERGAARPAASVSGRLTGRRPSGSRASTSRSGRSRSCAASTSPSPSTRSSA